MVSIALPLAKFLSETWVKKHPQYRSLVFGIITVFYYFLGYASVTAFGTELLQLITQLHDPLFNRPPGPFEYLLPAWYA